MRQYWFLLALLWAALSENSWGQRLRYTIQAVAHTPHALRVDLTYDTADTTATVFRYANNTWGETALGACLRDVHANGPVQRQTVGDWVLLTVQHRPGQRVRLRYCIQPDRTDTLRYERTYRPIMEQGYFHLYGFGLLVQPARYWTNAAPHQAVRVRWHLPPAWPLLTSFAPQTARRVRVQGPASLLESCVFAGGAVQVRALPIGDGSPPVWLATRPFRNLALDSAARHLQLAVRTQRAFWRDTSQASLAVTLLPTYERQPADPHRRRVSVSGTALLHSFSAFATDNAGPVIAERVDYLFFHELMHQWIGKQLRIRHEERQYWFSEGFTEYFQTQLRLQTKVLTPAQYIQEVNQDVLQALYHSPVRTVPNDSITYQRFWTSQDYEKLPYRRGFLFALYLDTHLKLTTSRSLADCLRRLLAQSYTSHPQGFTDLELLALIHEVTGFDPTAAYQLYIKQGHLIEFTPDSLPPGLRVQAAADQTPQFELAPAQAEAFYQFMVR